ncbi:MAG: hypothetical protein OSB00_09365 [Sphingomonas bacterium]|nr:hypothetical protein [Sphingomonas bacterium]
MDLSNRMNAVEIEDAISDLVLQPFDAAEFPFQFVTAFGAKKATVDRLRATRIRLRSTWRSSSHPTRASAQP